MYQKIKKNKYNSFQEFYDDIILIWDNAKKYNQINSIIYEDAVRNYTDKIFKEKKLDNKVKFNEKIKNVINKEQDDVNEQIDINKEDNSFHDVEINLNDEEFYNMLIGKKRKKLKENETSEKEVQDINEEESTPIFGINNDENNKDSLGSKTLEISNYKKNTDKAAFISNLSNSNRINDDNNNILIDKNDISNNNELDNNNNDNPNIIDNQESKNNNNLINTK